VFPHVRAGAPITIDDFARAIAEFQFTLVFADAPIDRYARGVRTALTPSQKRGAVLFFGRAGCVTCHSVSGRSNEMFSDFRQHVAAENLTMARWLPDPSFYPSPRLAMEAAPEKLAYVALLATGDNGKRDAIGVVDTDPESSSYGTLVGRTDFPQGGNELHHFGWNACSSHLCPYAPHAHVERRYLVVPGTHSSSRIHVLDTQPDPRNPRLVKVIEGEEVMRKTGYAAPHTVHCGPDGVYMNALGAPTATAPAASSCSTTRRSR
jgi:hypothetical protein